MKKIFTLILLLISIMGFSQNHINIGSTKAEVKKIQGEPTGIESYEQLGEEIWRYGEFGNATVTFKKGKVKAFSNYDHILKIGDTSKKVKSSEPEKPQSKEEFWKNIEEKAKNYEPKAANAYGEDPTGLYGSATQDIKRFPKEYEEMAEAKGLSPYEMPDEYKLQQMQKEYNQEKYVKWGLISLVIVGVFYFIFKFNRRKE